MQFIDLKTPYKKLEIAINQRINKVLEHGQFILGPEVEELEEQLAAYVGVKHCITVASGTDALLIAMMALGVRAGDEVITSPFTFAANAEMIMLLGAKPVFVDIDPRTCNINPTLIESAISSKTKAILPVSLYGQCADLDAINTIANRFKLPVIEDAAQSFGATYKGKRSCGLTTIATTSFFPSKPLGCYGEGGACFTNEDALATDMRQIRVHGQSQRYHHRLLGINSRFDTLQAAILLAKLPLLEGEIMARLRVGEYYDRLLQDHLVIPYIEPHNTSVYAQYTIQADNRALLQSHLNSHNIPTVIHYPIPLHFQPAFAELGYKRGVFPVSEYVATRVLSLPMHPYLSEADQQKIAACVCAELHAKS